MKKLLLLVLFLSTNALSQVNYADKYQYLNISNYRICTNDSGVKFALRFSKVVKAKSVNQKVKTVSELAISYDDGISYTPIGHISESGGDANGVVRVNERNGQFSFGSIYVHYSMNLKEIGKYKYRGVVDIYRDYRMKYSDIPSDVANLLTKGPQIVTCEK